MAIVTKTLKSDGTGDYTSIAAWESNEQTDLVAAGDQHVLECYKGTTVNGDWQADGSLAEFLILQDWITDAVNNITIRNAPGNEHDGVLQSDGGNGFKLIAGGTATTLSIWDVFANVEGIELSNDGSATVGLCLSLRCQGTEVVNIRKVIMSYSGVRDDRYMWRPWYDNATYNIENCLIVGFNGGDTRGLETSGSHTLNISFCTMNVFTQGIRIGSGGADVTAKNNAIYTSFGTTAILGTLNAASTNNAANDATVDPYGTINDLSITDGVDFVSPSTNNYNAQSAGKLEDAGVAIGGITEDIRNFTRDDPPEIGAYEIQGVAPVKTEELYIKDGGVFVKYTPQIKVGGVWQEPKAYVKSGGAWVLVHGEP